MPRVLRSRYESDLEDAMANPDGAYPGYGLPWAGVFEL